MLLTDLPVCDLDALALLVPVDDELRRPLGVAPAQVQAVRHLQPARVREHLHQRRHSLPLSR